MPIVCFSGKGPSDLSAKILQRHFAKVIAAVSECPGILANELFSKELISQDIVDRTQLTSLTPYEKASAVVSAVQAKVAASGRDKELKKLCKVMSKHENMKKISIQIMEKYRKFFVMHV